MLKFQLFFITVTISKRTEKEKVAQLERKLFTEQILSEMQAKRDRHPVIF